jgi:hypothetical protein
MIGAFFKAIGSAIVGYITSSPVQFAFTAITAITGVKGYMQARQMMSQGQSIMANKTASGGKIPVVYGTRRVGAQVIYMDTSTNDSRHVFLVYAVSVGECDEMIGSSIQLDGNPLYDGARFRYGCYIGSDRNGETGYETHRPLNTVSQVGVTTDAGAGGFGTDPTLRYRITFNLHHGAASQTADPMLVASMPNWTSSHRVDGVCYIAAHYKFDKEGMFSGIPQLTVQVRGKRVYDPRDAGQTFGTPSTYKFSDNPALTFLDYISDNEYGKGLTASQINMSTFTAAANVCDVEQDQPYFNGSAKSITFSADSDDDYITVKGTSANDVWFQHKVGELLTLVDSTSTTILDGVQIKEVQRTEFFGQSPEYRIYAPPDLPGSPGEWIDDDGTTLVKVKRFHCNGYLDTNKNVMDNAKELLANMRGIFLYIDGQYELSIEDTATSSFTITDNDIIADAGVSIDYGSKDKRANKVIVEFFNANKKYELDTTTALHDATPEYYSDDGDEILEIKAEFPYITDPYIANNMAQAILKRSRKQTTIKFLGTSNLYKINVGDVVTFQYAGAGYVDGIANTAIVCRVEALELQANGLVSVSLIEYEDIYPWTIPSQEPTEELAAIPSAFAVSKPTNVSFTDTNSSSTGRPFLSWDAATDYPDYEYRVNLEDNAGNHLFSKIVNTNKCELTFTPTGTNYTSRITSINTLGTESDETVNIFTIADAPVTSNDVQANAVGVLSVTAGTNINNSGTATAPILNLDTTIVGNTTLDGNIIVDGNIDLDGTTTFNNGRGDVYFENNASSNPDGAGITLRPSTNPTNGSVFDIRRSGGASRMWVGNNLFSAGSGNFFVGTPALGNEYDATDYEIKLNRNGNIVCEGTVTENGTVSDIRKKEHIEPIDNAVERLQKIKGITFSYKNKPEENRLMGVIAQDLLEDDILKLAVYDHEDFKLQDDDPLKNTYAVRYNHLTAILIEAVKEQQQQIDTLKTEIENIKKRNISI